MNAKQRRKRDRAESARIRLKYHIDFEPLWQRRLGFEACWHVAWMCWFLEEMRQRIEAGVMEALKNEPKVPFTDTGVKAIEDAVKKVIMESNELDLGYQQTVEFDPAQPGDRESRMLRGVTFSVPIHPITITGKIDV